MPRKKRKKKKELEDELKEAEPKPKPKTLAPPEPPKFLEGIEWSYTPLDIEEFRKQYKKFLKEYEAFKATR